MSNASISWLLVEVGHPQGVFRDQVDLAADLLDLGVGVDVVAEAGDVGLDPDIGRDLVHLGLVPVVAPGQPVERAGRPGRGRAADWRRGRRAGGAVGATVGGCRRRAGALQAARNAPSPAVAPTAPASFRNSRRSSCGFRSAIPCSSNRCGYSRISAAFSVRHHTQTSSPNSRCLSAVESRVPCGLTTTISPAAVATVIRV